MLAFVVTTVLWVFEVFASGTAGQEPASRRRCGDVIGRTAVVSAPCFPEGQVRLDGETWDARCAAGADPGAEVRVPGREKLTLIVDPARLQKQAARAGERQGGTALTGPNDRPPGARCRLFDPTG